MSSVVPEGWSNSPLQDICFFQEGPGLRNWQYRDSGTKFINIRCIQGGDINTSVAQHLSDEEVKEKYSHFLLNEGDYVLSSSGTIGRLALVKKHHLPLLLNTSVIRFRSIDETRLDGLFLRHFLQSKQFFDKISEQSQGSAQVNFGPTHLKVLDALLPPLPEQKKIASILTSVDEVIENTQKQIDKLQDLKKATMNELLTKGIGHTEFKDSELGRIPKSWEVVTLKDYCKRVCVGFVGTCEPYYRPTGIPLIRTGDLKGGLSEIVNGKCVTKEFHEKEKKSQLVSGDLLIARHGDFGQTCLVPESFGEANCLNIVIVRPNTQFYAPKFLKYLFNSDSMKRSFEAKAEGSTQKVISTTEISKAVFPMPTLSEQEEIVHILESLDSSIDAKRAKLSHTQSLKKSLMQDLLTGKVRVTVN